MYIYTLYMCTASLASATPTTALPAMASATDTLLACKALPCYGICDRQTVHMQRMARPVSPRSHTSWPSAPRGLRTATAAAYMAARGLYIEVMCVHTHTHTHTHTHITSQWQASCQCSCMPPCCRGKARSALVRSPRPCTSSSRSTPQHRSCTRCLPLHRSQYTRVQAYRATPSASSMGLALSPAAPAAV